MDDAGRWITVAKVAAKAIMEQYPDGDIPAKDEAMLVVTLCELVAHLASARHIDPALVILTLLKALTEQGLVEQAGVPPLVPDNGRVH